MDTGDAHCWSDGFSGQIDHSNTSSIGTDETPASANHLDVAGSILQGADWFEHSGAQANINVTRCWSDELSGPLG